MWILEEDLTGLTTTSHNLFAGIGSSGTETPTQRRDSFSGATGEYKRSLSMSQFYGSSPQLGTFGMSPTHTGSMTPPPTQSTLSGLGLGKRLFSDLDCHTVERIAGQGVDIHCTDDRFPKDSSKRGSSNSHIPGKVLKLWEVGPDNKLPNFIIYKNARGLWKFMNVSTRSASSLVNNI